MSTRDFIETDYYAALGVGKDATQAEIKKAYRKLARKHHPDANASDKAAEERFKAVSEAYDVLSDPQRRKEYDEARALFAAGGFRRAPGTGGPGGYGAGGFNINLGDLFGGGGGAGGGFGDIFGGLFGGGGGNGRGAGARRGGDVETEVTLDFAEAVHGVTVPLRLSSPHLCDACRGSGARPGTSARTCPTCRGNGTATRNQGGFAFAEPCQDCRGSGRLVDEACRQCRGSGQTSRERTITVRIPPGVADGQRIRLKGKGSPGERGGPAGDLYVVVHVTPDRVFARKGDHLTVTVPVTFPEAALGAEISVPTMDGAVTLKVPPGTAGGRTFRVRGRGVPRNGGRSGERGDLLVTVEVVVPAKLSAKARRAVQELAEELTGDPRAHMAGAAGTAGTREGDGVMSDGTDERPVYVISIAAELAGMHPQTLRSYDRLGLVSPGRAQGRGRRYSERDVGVLREVQRLSQDEGVNLAGIKRIIELREEVDALREQVAGLQAQVAEAHEAADEREAQVRASYRRDLVPFDTGRQILIWRPERRRRST